jgi:hypothetical protein
MAGHPAGQAEAVAVRPARVPAARPGFDALAWRLTLVLVVVLALVRLSYVALNEDVAFLLLAAERLASGGKFGTDLLEMNTPPAVLIYLPAEALHQLLGWPANLITQGLAVIVILCLVLITERVLRRALAEGDGGPVDDSLGFLTVASAYVLLLPAYQLGQRDHLVAAMILPYLATTTAIARERRIGRGLAFTSGALMALAIAVKPHYVLLLPVLWWSRWRRDGLRAWIAAPDILALVASGLVLAGLSFALFPEWLGVALVAVRYYDGLSRPIADLLADVARHDVAGLGAGILALVAWRFGRSIPQPLRDHMATLLKAAPVLLLTFLIQKKGFSYHLVPFDTVTQLSAFIAVYAVLAQGRRRGPWLAGGALTLLMALAAWNAADRRVAAADFAHDPVVAAIEEHDRGGGVTFLSTGLMPAIQATALYGTKWDLRSSALWPLPGLQNRLAAAGIPLDGLDAPQGDQRLVDDALWYRRSIIEDLRLYRPDIVLVQRDDTGPDARPDPRVLEFLAPDPGFAAVWADFDPAGRRVSSGQSFDLYVRKPASQ